MKQRFIIAIVSSILLLLVFVSVTTEHSETGPGTTACFANSCFPHEADELFASSVGDNVELNSGITMQRAMPLYSEQFNNITFAVFNHTDERIIFPNQGFGLTIFGYDAVSRNWKRLKLQHVPLSEPKILPPKLETWDLETNNSWDVLENDTTKLGYEHVRLYVSGTGMITGRRYGGYLDVTISLLP